MSAAMDTRDTIAIMEEIGTAARDGRQLVGPQGGRIGHHARIHTRVWSGLFPAAAQKIRQHLNVTVARFGTGIGYPAGRSEASTGGIPACWNTTCWNTFRRNSSGGRGKKQRKPLRS